MKKLAFIAFMMLFPAAFAGCVDNNDTNRGGADTRISLTAGIEETRTDISDPANPVWTEGDAIGIHIFNKTQGNLARPNWKLTSTLEDGGRKATFAGTVQGLGAGEYTIAGYYPHAPVGNSTPDINTGKIRIPDTQKPTATSFDPAADILVMYPITHTHDGASPISYDDMYFKRVLGMIRIVLNSPELNGEAIKRLTFTTDDASLNLAGLGNFNLTDGTFGGFASGATATVTVTPNGEIHADGRDFSTICIPEITIGTGVKMTIEGETEGFTFKKSHVVVDPIEIKAGGYHTMNIALAGDDIKAKATDRTPFVFGRSTYVGSAGAGKEEFILEFFPYSFPIPVSEQNGIMVMLDCVFASSSLNMGSSVEILDLPEGIYPINMTANANTVYASEDYSGVVNMVKGNMATIWALKSGTMSIAGDHTNYTIQFDIVHSGGELHAEYKGPWNIKNPKYSR